MWKTERILPMLHGWRRIGRVEDLRTSSTNDLFSLDWTNQLHVFLQRQIQKLATPMNGLYNDEKN